MAEERSKGGLYVAKVRFLGIFPMMIKYRAKGLDDAVDCWKHSWWYKVVWIRYGDGRDKNAKGFIQFF